MFSKFDEESQRVMINAKKEMQSLKHPYVGSEHLMLAILKDSNDVSSKLQSLKIDYKSFKNEVIRSIGVGSESNNLFLYTPLLKRTLENAVEDAKETNNGIVTVSNLFYSILEEGEGVAVRILLLMNVDLDKLYSYFSKNITKKKSGKKKLTLDELGVDLTNTAKLGLIDPVIGREKEINRLLEILCRRTKNNPILIGEAGVGKTAIVEELANRIVNNNVPDILKNKKIISLDMASSVAGTKYRGEFEERMKKVLSELEDNDDIILFIDEIHTIMGAGGAEGAIDASNIFKPSLARGKMRCIGATTIEEYKKYIESDGALDRRFQKIEVKEPNKKEVKDILLKLKPIYETHHEVIISEKMIDKIIEMSNRYIHDRFEPDKSIDVLDEVCSKVSLKENENDLKIKKLYNELNLIVTKKNQSIINDNFANAYSLKEKEDKLKTRINKLELKNNKLLKEVCETDIIEVIKSKINIPILSFDNKYIDSINEELKNVIIGQDNALSELSNISKRLQLNISNSSLVSILFCGPSGVGKTLLAKTYGKLLVGSENVIKLDMSEFSESHSISKIIGAPPGYVGYNDFKNLLEEIKDKPNAVLILDEIERCSKNVLNVFMQILDEGYTKDSKGKTIFFDNVTIIMTSNIGFNKNNLGFNNNETSTNKLKDELSTPFVNRISKVINFNYINEESAIKIINNKINKLKEKYNVKLNISDEFIKDILDLSKYEIFGARKIDEIVKSKIENVILDELSNGKKVINLSEIENKITQ